MFAGLANFWRNIMTEDSANSVYCPVRIAAASLVSTDVGATIWQSIAHGTFDAVAFGTGSAALLAAVGAGVGIKAKLGADAP